MQDYIDYSEEGTDDSPDCWTASAFKLYFKDMFWKTHKIGMAVPWTLKEQSLLKKMRAEYEPSDLVDMIIWWHAHEPDPLLACQFRLFYSRQQAIYIHMSDNAKEYKWE